MRWLPAPPVVFNEVALQLCVRAIPFISGMHALPARCRVQRVQQVQPVDRAKGKGCKGEAVRRAEGAVTCGVRDHSLTDGKE